MPKNIVNFPWNLTDFLQHFLLCAKRKATKSKLHEIWNDHGERLRSDAPYDELLEFFIAIDEATRPPHPDSVGAIPLPESLSKPSHRRLRALSPLAEYARKRYGGFQVAYPYMLPLEAFFGADDPALYISKAGAELFPLHDPVSPHDDGPYAKMDLTTLALDGTNHWLIDSLLEWAEPRVGSELVGFLRAVANGSIGDNTPPQVRVYENTFLPSGAAFWTLKSERTHDLLAVYTMKNARNDDDIQIAFSRLAMTSEPNLRVLDFRHGGALFHCLNQNALETLVRGASRLGDEYDPESCVRTEKEYLVVAINDSIAALMNRGTKRAAPFSLKTTKVIFDRLLKICPGGGLNGVITDIPFDKYAREIGYLIEPCLSAIIADSLMGGRLIEPVSDTWPDRSSDNKFYGVGISASVLDRMLRRAKSSVSLSQGHLITDMKDVRFRVGSTDGGLAGSDPIPVFRYVIERAIQNMYFELASSIVAFLVFGAAYRTQGTFRLPIRWRAPSSALKEIIPGLVDDRGYLETEHDISDVLGLVPLGLGLQGGARVRKAVTIAAKWARDSGSRDMAARLRAFLPKDPRRPVATTKSVARLIAAGEGHTVEFKETIRFDIAKNEIEKKNDRVISLSWLKALGAFVNTDGGSLFLGVKDDKSVCGLDRDAFDSADKRQRFIRDRIEAALGSRTHGLVTISEPRVGGKPIVWIQCQPAAPERVYLRESAESAGELWLRTGPRLKRLDGEDLAEHITRMNRLWGYSRAKTPKPGGAEPLT